MTLTEIFNRIGNFSGQDIGCNDKNSLHSYLPEYDKLLASYRNGGTLLEIGLALGDSIRLWDEYFDNSVIVGVDISLVFQPLSYKNVVKLIQADATKPSITDTLSDYSFDVIIDDGSHMENDQVSTFNMLKHKVKPGGVYIIEDILALDSNRSRFESLHSNCEIVDLRKVKGRFDDTLIIYKF